MVHLPKSLASRGTPEFEKTFKAELLGIDPQLLPLQQGLTHSNHALTHDLTFVLLHHHEEGDELQVKVGIFYQGIIAGCSCADDPTPSDEVTEYCEVLVRIDIGSGEAQIELL